jgi:hypothetical protein
MKKLAVIFAIALISATNLCHGAWTSPHGDPDNTGFARVDTAPAAFENQVGFANIGPVAPGANPVTAPDGTVYVGNLLGEMIALRANGTPYWKRQLNTFHGGIFASPVIGADGSIYVISGQRMRDHLSGSTSIRDRSFLHKFTPGGGWLYAMPFPTYFQNLAAFTTMGFSTAPPNIWRYNGVESVIVPVSVNIPGGFDIRLLAFDALGGAVLADQRVTVRVYDVTSSSPIIDAIGDFFETIGDCISSHGCPFSASGYDPIAQAGLPMPGVAIWANPGGSPWVWVADGVRSTLAFKFDPAAGFEQIFRFDDKNDRRSTAPTALNNVVAAIGTEDGRVKFERTGTSLAGFGPLSATPTRMADGRLVVIDRLARMSLLRDGAIAMQTQLNGYTLAAAAASCTHLFVSTSDEFVTYDAHTMTPVAKLPWTGGGLYPPVIGPSGHVYGMTKWGLFVFAPPTMPRRGPAQFIGRTSCDRTISTFSTGKILVR